MNIKTSIVNIEIEWLLFIIILISVFSAHFRGFIKLYFIYYLFIVFHELSHVFIASILGRKVKKIKLLTAGACAEFEDLFGTYDFNQNIINIFVYIAGPLSNFILALIFKNNLMIFQINMFLAVINLIPIFPLDGYNILKNLLYLLKNFKIFKINVKLILKISEIVFVFFLSLISIFQIFVYYNPSLILFILYIYIINKSEKQKTNIYSKINQMQDIYKI